MMILTLINAIRHESKQKWPVNMILGRLFLYEYKDIGRVCFWLFFKITSSAGTDTGADCGGITLTVALAEWFSILDF